MFIRLILLDLDAILSKKELTMSKIGILHPGEMGVSIATSAINS